MSVVLLRSSYFVIFVRLASVLASQCSRADHGPSFSLGAWRSLFSPFLHPRFFFEFPLSFLSCFENRNHCTPTAAPLSPRPLNEPEMSSRRSLAEEAATAAAKMSKAKGGKGGRGAVAAVAAAAAGGHHGSWSGETSDKNGAGEEVSVVSVLLGGGKISLLSAGDRSIEWYFWVMFILLP